MPVGQKPKSYPFYLKGPLCTSLKFAREKLVHKITMLRMVLVKIKRKNKKKIALHVIDFVQ
jgi:hypothetical protein